MKIRQLLENTMPFTTSTTNMPTYDDMMKMPEYHRDKKGWVFTIMHMSPDEYINEVYRYWKHFGALQPHDDMQTLDRRQSPKLVDRYAAKMKQGEKFPMPVLDHRSHMGWGSDKKEKSFSQEGLHRAYAAKKLGVTQMPVMVVDDAE